MLSEVLDGRTKEVLEKNQKLYEFKKIACNSVWTKIEPQVMFVDLFNSINVNEVMIFDDIDCAVFRKEMSGSKFILNSMGDILIWNFDSPISDPRIFEFVKPKDMENKNCVLLYKRTQFIS